MTEDPFLHDDAPYVLGALSPTDRAAFEQHLTTCDECGRRVAELRLLPGLLAGLDESTFRAEVLDPANEPVPDTLLPSLLRTVRREQSRRRRLITVLAGVAAASVIALSTVLAWPSATHAPAGSPMSMTALVSSPVHATAKISSTSWGTRIELACRYDSSYGSDTNYWLVVIDKQGNRSNAGSWRLSPDEVTQFTGGTAVPRSDIAAVLITAGQTPILRLNL